MSGAPVPPPDDRAAAEAFARAVLDHLDALYAFARRLTRNAADAEDLVQETMLKGLRARRSFQPGTNLKAWLFTIMRRTFLDRVGRPTLEGAESLLAAQHGGDPEPALLAAASRDALEAALSALPVAFRATVWLVDVEEMSLAEAADVLGCPVGTVKSRLSRARALLRLLLKDEVR
ncbi:MAG TPA: RNA polymerase sigma factor [Thermodesulfobacteriota bacterium]|nr:RNA polymerase sigma factor [Thermodesulfobacteriota bacterium]